MPYLKILIEIIGNSIYVDKISAYQNMQLFKLSQKSG